MYINISQTRQYSKIAGHLKAAGIKPLRLEPLAWKYAVLAIKARLRTKACESYFVAEQIAGKSRLSYRKPFVPIKLDCYKLLT